MPGVIILPGDMRVTLKPLPKNHVDAVVCDPPYGISFMGKDWDREVPGPDYWRRAWHRLKPGGHLVAFSSARTYHHLATAIELAGFELRDQLMWIYGSGMPKGQNLSKAMDKTAHSAELWEAIRAHLRTWMEARGMTKQDLNAAVGSALTGGGMAAHWVGVNTQPEIPSKAQWEKLRGLMGWPLGDLDAAYDLVKDGAQRPVIGVRELPKGLCFNGEAYGGDNSTHQVEITASATDEARRWEGWSTALKPAHEPIVLARKPLSEPTVAQNVRKWGTGALNIGACRIASTGREADEGRPARARRVTGDTGHSLSGGRDGSLHGSVAIDPTTEGRWPANVLLDEEAAKTLDAQSGVTGSVGGRRTRGGPACASDLGLMNDDNWKPKEVTQVAYGDSGGASRFFYCSKAKASDRAGSNHPTVKPIDVMRWLVDLVTPPGGIVLDPFAGSGTTGEAALAAGHNVILCEKEPEHIEALQRRFAGRTVELFTTSV